MVTRPSSSCSAASSRASSVSGLRTAPPNEPECRSPAGPRRSSWPSVMPAHAGADGRRLARPHAGVGDHDDVAGAAGRACSREQGGEVRRAGLLLALDEQLEGDRGAGAAGRREVGADAEGVEADLALVVGGAARVQPVAVDASARTAGAPTARAGRPAARRGGRRRATVGASASSLGHSANTAGRPAVSHTSTVGNPVSRSAWASHSADRRTSRRGRGRRRSTGCAATRPGSATMSSAPAATAVRTAVARCRSSCAEPYDRAPARRVGPVRLATFNLLTGGRCPTARSAPRTWSTRSPSWTPTSSACRRSTATRTGPAASTRRRSWPRRSARGWSRFVPARRRHSRVRPGRRPRADDGSLTTGPTYGVGLVSRLPGARRWQVRRFGAGADRAAAAGARPPRAHAWCRTSRGSRWPP